MGELARAAKDAHQACVQSAHDAHDKVGVVRASLHEIARALESQPGNVMDIAESAGSKKVAMEKTLGRAVQDKARRVSPVSYTHLTLPTILLV